MNRGVFMQNIIRRLLPMILCLIMALSIAIGMGNFALADEIVDEKNDGKRVIKSFKEDTTITKSTARTEIEEAIAAGTANSASVAIMDGGKLIYAEGFGMADREKNIPADQDTVFNIGSVSKMFAATAIMLLVDEGKVALDNPVTSYLTEFTMADERYKDITVRMLLNHSSGLPGSTIWNNFGSEYNQNIYRELLASLSRSTIKHRPGELATYCNDGYTLAEMIVAKVSDQSYGDFLAERVFKPLSLNHTGLGVGRLPEGMNPARFYRPDGKSEPLEIASLLATGGLSSTAENLCQFADSFSEGSAILSPQSRIEMLKRQPSELQGKLRGDSFPFGLGWDFAELSPYSEKDLHLYGKTGGTGHYNAMLYTVPSQRISVAVIASGAQCDSPGIALSILSAYLEEKGLITQEEKVVQEPVKAQTIPSGLLTYEGYYDSGGITLRIALDDEKGMLNLYLVDGSDESALLSAVYNDGFFYDGENKYYFTTVDGARYFVVYSPIFDFHNVKAEKLQAIADPHELSIPMDGKVWLRRNVKAAEAAMFLPNHIVSSSRIPALPGYVDFDGMKIVKSPDHAGMPVKSMRDLTELILVEQNGATWAWLSGADYMPAELAPPLNTGANTLTIGSAGRNEWLTVDFVATLCFEVPAKGRVIVFGEKGILYDSMVDSGDITVPAGSLLEVAGNPGDLFQVTASAAETPVAVVSISLNKAQTSLRVGDYETLTAAVDPADATDANKLTWKSSNESVATVDSSGKVRAMAPGTARITAEAGGIKSAACVVTVLGGSGSGGSHSGEKTTPPETPEPAIPNTDAPGAVVFTDIANYSWAREAIMALAEKGVIKGVSDTSFAPANQIKRADYMLLMVRLLGVTADVVGNFDDVAENKYYYKEIGIARALGLTSDVDGANFQPEVSITRQDMFVLAYRILQRQGLINTEGDPGVLNQFSDSDEISQYARQALATLVSMDLVQGSANMLNPRGNATRAEAAVFIHKLSSLL